VFDSLNQGTRRTRSNVGILVIYKLISRSFLESTRKFTQKALKGQEESLWYVKAVIIPDVLSQACVLLILVMTGKKKRGRPVHFRQVEWLSPVDQQIIFKLEFVPEVLANMPVGRSHLGQGLIEGVARFLLV
jgi:hypothetical protein